MGITCVLQSNYKNNGYNFINRIFGSGASDDGHVVAKLSTIITFNVRTYFISSNA